MGGDSGNEPVNENKDTQIHFVKYKLCINVIGILGAISQIALMVIIMAFLITGLDNHVSPVLKPKAVVYSGIGMTMLTGTAFSEILLLRAINQRIFQYIQWWMVSSLILLILSVLMVVISGFTLYQNAWWITLSFLYITIRLPFQMYFVDSFTHAEIFHKQANPPGGYTSVLYRRFH